jgi:thioredoxin 1
MGRRTRWMVAAMAAAGALGAGLVGAAGQRQAVTQAPAARPLPRLVDLGAGRCIPCKAMAPILDGLKAEYAGRMEVQFIDVWKEPEEATPFGIHVIPTQIFLGADGRELARHQGFMGKDEILAQWNAVGVRF